MNAAPRLPDALLPPRHEEWRQRYRELSGQNDELRAAILELADGLECLAARDGLGALMACDNARALLSDDDDEGGDDGEQS